MNKILNFGGDPDDRLDTGIVFRIRYYYEIGITWTSSAAVMTSLRHWPLAEVCNVPVLLVLAYMRQKGSCAGPAPSHQILATPLS